MEFRVLGTFEVINQGISMAVTGPKQRELLALLLINANIGMSADRIMDELWGDEAPGLNTLRFHISKLRRILDGDPGPLVTMKNGYRLEADPDSIDAAQFETAVTNAGKAMTTDLAVAATYIEQARNLWRGDPYPGAEYRRFGEIEIRRLQELHLTFLAREQEISLGMGKHDEVVGELEGLVTQHPLHERFWELLMLALYRSGRQADALRAYQRAKAALGEELGIDPSAALSDLEEQILLQAPAISYVPTAPSNLPSPASSFVGRASELEALPSLVLAERMVTLVGPGGIGKTRLAVEIGHRLHDRFPDGAWFCDLTTAGQGGVPAALIGSLPIEEDSQADPLATVVDWASERTALLIVDNCEHVIDDAGDAVSELISQCPQLHVIATSRERLGVDGEWVWDLDGLAIPEEDSTPDAVLASEAVQLLVDRARRFDRTFVVGDRDTPGIASLTVSLDGIPLALELVAAHLRASSFEELVDQISESIDALGDSRRRGPDRHQTMRASLDWSYRLLDPATARVFRKLGVFRGGIDPAAATAVAGNSATDALERLVDVSLLKIDRSAPNRRYRILETIREYAETTMKPEELASARAAHVRFFADFAAAKAVDMGTGARAAAIEALRRDHKNLQGAISAARRADPALEITLVASLGPFWFDAGFHSEARTAFAAAIERDDLPPSPELGDALEQLVQLYAWSGAVERAYELADQQAEIAAALDDERASTRVLASRGILGFITGDYRAAIKYYEAMLAVPETSTTASVAYINASLAYLHTWTGEPERAEKRFAEAIEHAERFALEDRFGIIGDYQGWAAFQRGDNQDAAAHWQSGEEAYAELGLRPMQADMCQLRGWALLTEGDHSAAAPLIEKSIAEMEELGLAAYVARGHMLHAVADFTTDQQSALERLASAAAESHRIRSRPNLAWCLWYGASLAAQQGRNEQAGELRRLAEPILLSIPLVLPAGFRRRDAELSDLADSLGEPPAAQHFDIEATRTLIIG